MPHVSKSKGVLLRLDELAILFGKSRRSVERQLKKLRDQGTPASSEEVTERHKAGAAVVPYYDPATLGWEMPESCLRQIQDGGDRPQSPPPVSATCLRHLVQSPPTGKTNGSDA